ncbi:hypothetical protein [Isoalcanivorax indicus]|uniref:hypothetical protein n=1 Tax=Isoalcanivorax indicus TaxID=2202653 RepID=UPI000DB9AD17|nr:hypothetical protein [Isoalcanivorax indicus]
MEYRLQLLFDKKALREVKNARQRIMLAKPVNSGTPNVVWQSIDPFQSTEVVWKEEYGIYASNAAIQHGAQITKISETGVPAQDGAYYTLTPQALFEGPNADQQVPRGTFAAHNQMPYDEYPSLTFGLTQSALINQMPVDRKPISATPVLATQAAAMTPFTQVYIWLQAEFSSETIITKIFGAPTIARFGGDVTDLTLEYNPQIGKFTEKD